MGGITLVAVIAGEGGEIESISDIAAPIIIFVAASPDILVPRIVPTVSIVSTSAPPSTSPAMTIVIICSIAFVIITLPASVPAASAERSHVVLLIVIFSVARAGEGHIRGLEGV